MNMQTDYDNLYLARTMVEMLDEYDMPFHRIIQRKIKAAKNARFDYIQTLKKLNEYLSITIEFSDSNRCALDVDTIKHLDEDMIFMLKEMYLYFTLTYMKEYLVENLMASGLPIDKTGQVFEEFENVFGLNELFTAEQTKANTCSTSFKKYVYAIDVAEALGLYLKKVHLYDSWEEETSDGNSEYCTKDCGEGFIITSNPDRKEACRKSRGNIFSAFSQESYDAFERYDTDHVVLDGYLICEEVENEEDLLLRLCTPKGGRFLGT